MPHGAIAGRAMVMAVGAVSVLLSLVVTGCGSAHHTSGDAAGGSGSASVQRQAGAVWHDFARCARSHGLPNFPDPQVDAHGQPVWPGDPGTIKREMGQVQGPCGSILSQLPATAVNPPPTAAELQQMLAFSRCMRQHGVPQWPDPKSDGTFPLSNTPLAHTGKTPAVGAAMQSCTRYYSGGINAS